MAEPSRSTTTTHLLEALHDAQDDATWRVFDARYRPIIRAFAIHLGLEANEAEDVAQQTLLEFVRSYREGQYRRERGRLRSWLVAIAKHRAIDLLRERRRRRAWRGASAIAVLPNDEHLTRIWTRESERAIFAEALRELERTSRTDERTIRAFERLALHGVPPDAVAEEFGLTVDETYRIKHRVIRSLRSIVARLTDDWDEVA